MVDLLAVAGSKIYIGGVKASQAANFVAGDFSGESWTEIDGWTQMGVIGDAAQVITSSLINRGRDVKQKGTKNAGSMQNTFAVIGDDTGQAALLAALGTSDNYAFKLLFDDAATSPASPAPVGTIKYFVGLVISAQEAGGAANTVRTMNTTIEINSNVVTVAPNP